MTRGVTKAERHKAVIGIIAGLIKKLGYLAPHPSRPGYTGPQFLLATPYHNLPAAQDSMLGQIFMDSLLTPAFAEASADTPCNIGSLPDMDKISDIAGEYMEDRHQPETREGRGSLATCKQRAITNGFNFQAARPALHAAMLEAFRADLPKRRIIENNIAFFGSRLLEPAIS